MLENFAIFLELLKEYGDFWRLWTGPELNVVVQDPNDVEVESAFFCDVSEINQFRLNEILIANLDPFDEYKIYCEIK